MNPIINAQTLFSLCSESLSKKCSHCASFDCEGWETRPASFLTKNYPIVGTLQTKGSEDHWEEYPGTTLSLWSTEAPIAVNYYPYNRSDVLRCLHCKRVYLSYTEFGGYYVDQRIRLVKPDLIVLSVE